MDRTIDPSVRRRRTSRRLVVTVGSTSAVMILVMLVTGWLHPSPRRDQLRTARVERGDVSATLDASGLVVPGFEQILTAPVSTRVFRILRTPGTEVRPGEPVVLNSTTSMRGARWPGWRSRLLSSETCADRPSLSWSAPATT